MTKRNKLLFGYFAVMCALTFVRICFIESFFGDLSDIDSDRLFSTLAQVVCMGIIPLVVITLTDKKKTFVSISNRIGYRKIKWDSSIWIILAICILHPIINGGITTVWNYLIRATGYTPTVADPERYVDFGAFLLGVFFSAVLPATFEELAHRSLALEMTRGSVTKRVVMQAVLFALMHQNITQTGYTFVGGLIFGALTVITGSIFPAMLAHFINNLFVCIRIYSESIDGIVASCMEWIYSFCATWWGMAIACVLWAGCVIGTIYLFKTLYKHYGQKITIPVDKESCKKSDNVLSTFLWIAIIVLGALTTLYSYIWGLMR